MKNAIRGIRDAAIAIGVFVASQYLVIVIYETILILNQLLTFGYEECMKNGIDSFLANIAENVTSEISITLLVSGLLTIAIMVLVFTLMKRNIFEVAGFSKMDNISLIPSFMAGVGFNLLVSTLIPLIPFPESWVASYVDSASKVTDGNFVLAIIASVLLTPVVEELVFRGVMHNALRKIMPVWLSAIIVSFVFGLFHGQFIWMIYTFLFSMLMIYIEERTGSLKSTIVVHIAFNAAGIFFSLLGDLNVVAYYALIAGGVVLTAGGITWITLAKSYKEYVEDNKIDPDDKYEDSEASEREEYLASLNYEVNDK